MQEIILVLCMLVVCTTALKFGVNSRKTAGMPSCMMAKRNSKVLKKDNDFPPPPPNSRGEWDDWDKERDLDDEFRIVEDDSTLNVDDIPQKTENRTGSTESVSFMSFNIDQGTDSAQGLSQKPISRRSSMEENWSDWSEEPPYFDDEVDSEMNKDPVFTEPKAATSPVSHIPLTTSPANAASTHGEKPVDMKSELFSLQSTASRIDSRLQAIEKLLESNRQYSSAPNSVIVQAKSDISAAMQFCFLLILLTFEVILVTKL